MPCISASTMSVAINANSLEPAEMVVVRPAAAQHRATRSSWPLVVLFLVACGAQVP